MKESAESQGHEKEELPLEHLLKKAGLSSWEELAAMISIKSGQSISGATLRRHAKRGWEGWLSLELSVVQMDAVVELTGISYEDLPRTPSFQDKGKK